MKKDVHLTQERIVSILKDYLNYMKQSHFSLTTDDQAVAHLQKQLNIIGLDLTNPKTSKIKENVLRVIDQSENNGDLHFKMLLGEA